MTSTKTSVEYLGENVGVTQRPVNLPQSFQAENPKAPEQNPDVDWEQEWAEFVAKNPDV
jgi:hypothetical protein